MQVALKIVCANHVKRFSIKCDVSDMETGGTNDRD